MNSKIFIIAEIAQAHEGNFKKALAYIDALANTGVDAVKFQMHMADAESSVYEPFRIPMSGFVSRMAYWRAMEFNIEQWQQIKQACEASGMEFLCSPFSIVAIDQLEKLGVKRYKVGSGEVTNFLMLERLAQTGKPVILSSGMSNLKELDKAVQFFKERQIPVSVLQCTTAYPTQPEQYGLNMIHNLKVRYDVPIGYSDHSAHPETCLAAMALGGEILEFHVILDENDTSGPDAMSSLTIHQVKALVKAIRRLELAFANPVDKTDMSSYVEMKKIFEKSLAINKSLTKGHVLTFEDLEAKKPKGYGIDAAEFKEVLGRILNKPLSKWSFLNWEDLV